MLELEAERAELLDALRVEFGALTPEQKALSGRVAAIIGRSASVSYAGDSLADDLKSDAGLSSALSETAIYLRGPLDALSNPANVPGVAKESRKDTFVSCLLAPPTSHTEKALRARAVHLDLGPSAQISPLFSLLAVAPLWGPAWRDSVKSASSAELEALTKVFRRAPVKSGVLAAKATQLLLVLDAPADLTAPAELDGERPHLVRVSLIDLRTEQVRLRLRRAVDPGWLGAAARAEYASRIDGCSLALSVRAAANGATLEQAPRLAAEAGVERARSR